MQATPRSVRLAVRDLSVGFEQGAQRLTAVHALSFSLYAGETFALLGESGCGKSLTAQALMRLLPPAGRYWGGQVGLQQDEGETDVLTMSGRALREVRGGRLAMIFQEPGTSLNPVLKVGEQISEVLAVHRGLQGEAAQAVALDLLQQVGIADAARRLQEYPFQFSGGMKQRVMIALALAGEPDILIADEPTTALDVTVQAQILDLLQTVQAQRGMAMLLITHDLGVLARMADRIGVMYAGELVEVADRSAFFARPAHPYSQALFAALPEAVARGERLLALPGQVPRLDAMPQGCRFAARCPHAEARCRSESPVWQSLADGRQVRCWAIQADSGQPGEKGGGVPAILQETQVVEASIEQRADPQPMLAVADLRVHFPIRRGVFQRVVGHVKAVDGLSMQLAAGRTLALVGESGCGKTTVGKSLLQLIPAVAGTVSVAGNPWLNAGQAADAGQIQTWRPDMQMVFQDPFSSLNPRLRVGEILVEGLLASGKVAKPGQATPMLQALLERVGLPSAALERFPHEFSGGQRQRIAIARALAMQPKVVICDEPTSALDVSVQAQILNLLKDLQTELGLAYLFITHNFGVVRYLADDIAVMYLGRIVEQGRAEAVLNHPRHPYTQALLSAVPTLDGLAADRIRLLGELPSPASPPAGCHFHPRCPRAVAACRESYPATRSVAAHHQLACHLD